MKRLALSIMMALSVFVWTPAFALAVEPTDAAKSHACEGINEQIGGGCTKKDASFLNNVLEVSLNILSLVAGIAAVIMIILSGLKYITSAGESSKISSAKSTLIYAIVGLIVVAFAQFIVFFVLSNI